MVGDNSDRIELGGMFARHYEVIADVVAAPDGKRRILGEMGRCRFCGRETTRRFSKKAHAFPESMGNRTVFSRDECQDCNEIFGGYESHLCTSAGVLLTLGGTPGKRNKVRQTGGRNSPVRIKHRGDGPDRRISFDMNLERRAVGTTISFFEDQNMAIMVPAPPESFRPRLAYKALVKMGISILPEAELQHFRRLIGWLQAPEDTEAFPFLDVGFSFASVGNAPRFVRGTLLRRKADKGPVPYMIFMFAAGSACWQLDLMPDTRDDHLGALAFGCLGIRWSAHLSGGDGNVPIELNYGQPCHFDWAEYELCLPPIKAVDANFNYRTSEARIIPRFREQCIPGTRPAESGLLRTPHE